MGNTDTIVLTERQADALRNLSSKWSDRGAIHGQTLNSLVKRGFAAINDKNQEKVKRTPAGTKALPKAEPVAV